MKWLNKIDSLSFIVGRSLLGLYFIGPGLSKVVASTITLMKIKGVPFIAVTCNYSNSNFWRTALNSGRNLRIASFVLFGLTIIINIFIHNFWVLAGDPTQAHELQNFIKNLAIGAGLLVLATKR